MTHPDTASLLRLEVGRLRARERRRSFDPVVHLGRLGAAERRCPVPLADPLLDAGTRTEIVCRLLESDSVGDAGAAVWLARPGDPELQDDDLAWLAAADRAFGAMRCRLEGFWTVTRTGWLDVRTGEGRAWKRLRL